MRNVAAVLGVVLLSVTAASAQYKPKPAAPAAPAARPMQQNVVSSETSFQRISRTDAYKLFTEDKAVFIDVRSHEQFSYGHIRGALSIPNSQLIKRFREVTPGKIVITYCACDAEQSSGRAAVNLVAHGVPNVYALKGGWDEWKAAGLPIAAGPK